MTDQTTFETARALLWRHGLPEDVIDGALALHAQELAAVQRRDAAVWGVDTDAGKHRLSAADLIDPTRGECTPPAVQVPAADRAAQPIFVVMLGEFPVAVTATLEDAQRHALDGETKFQTPGRYEHRWDDSQRPGEVWRLLGRRVAPGRRFSETGRTVHVLPADAVLAVLPAPTDQAAVLRWAADQLDAGMERFFAEWPNETRNSPYALGQKDAAAELRRLADETPAAETQRTPCSVPECDADGTGEPCTRHEREDAHTEGDHELCDDDCSAAEAQPPGGYTARACRHCWTGIHWTSGEWVHADGPRGHAPEPPSLPAEPAAGARQDGAES
ncbi:hypothetical protein [Streptomyces sp. NPDC006610]|uniref:hypothetical protein n=1 Tax=Streptomyces sp. NPDC006610 TaxID=3154584 RepID=UPI0033B6AB39